MNAMIISEHEAAGLSVNQDTSARNRLNGRRLLLVQAGWVMITLVTLLVFIAALPPFFQKLHETNINAVPGSLQLFPEDAAALGEIGLSLDTYAALATAFVVLSTTAYLVLGTVVFWRRPDDWVALLTSLMMTTTGAFVLQRPIQFVLIESNPAWYLPVMLLLGISRVILMLFLYLFPDGRFIPRWTRWTAIMLAAYAQIPLLFSQSPLNPYQGTTVMLGLYFLILYSSGVYALVYRYQHNATPVQRQQTKWVVFGVVVAFIMVIAVPAIIAVLLPESNQPGLAHVLFSELFNQIVYTAAVALSVTCFAFSILRYRVWDIDVVIHRSLVYGGLTVLLGGVFIASVFIIQQILSLFTDGMFSPAALAISTLLIGGLFQPARSRLQRMVDKRFYHLRVDLDRFVATPPGILNPGALAGTQFGPYQVIEPLGRGGMSEVYKGFHPTLGRAVAIKILPPHLAEADDFRARFEREAQTVAGLRHSNIVHVFDFGVMDGTYYMVMEYIDGQDLTHYLRQHKRLTLDKARPLLRDVAMALDYAHTQGLVHRDIKPANIMLEAVTAPCAESVCHRAILMDFGVARVIASSSDLTKTGAIGTLDYMAPEQIVSAKEVDGRADIYALGIVAYQMLTGQLPFKTENAASLVFAHLQRPAPDARDLVPEIPESVAKAIQKALSKQPLERFQTASAFVTALEI